MKPAWQFGEGFCLGVVDGAVATAHNLDFCIPEQTPRIQIVRVVIHYMEEHPEQQHYQLSTLALLALRNSYPCHR
jgi:hypothetical protein